MYIHIIVRCASVHLASIRQLQPHHSCDNHDKPEPRTTKRTTEATNGAPMGCPAKCAYAQARKHPILRPEDKQTFTQTFALTVFKAVANAALYQTAHPRKVCIPSSPKTLLFGPERIQTSHTPPQLHNPLPHLHKRLPNMCAIQPRTFPRAGLRHPSQKPLYLCPERLTSGIKQLLPLIGDHGEDAPAVVGAGVPQGQSFYFQPP